MALFYFSHPVQSIDHAAEIVASRSTLIPALKYGAFPLSKIRRNPLLFREGSRRLFFRLIFHFTLRGPNDRTAPGALGVILGLDISLDDVERRTTTGHDTVAGRPEMTPPEHAANFRPALLAQTAGADPLHPVHKTRKGHLRRVREKNVDMVAIRLHGIYRRPHIARNRGDHLPQKRANTIRMDRAATIFGRKDQMRMQAMDNMSSRSEIFHFILSFEVETEYKNGMKENKAYRFRIYPTPEQEAAFRQISGCCRLVYNLGLEQRRTFWRQYRAKEGKTISWFGQKRELVALKAEAPFLRDAPAHCLQMALADLDVAFRRFFDGVAGYPRPRKKFQNDSFTFPDPEQIRVDQKTGHLVLPKFGKTSRDNGPIRTVFHRPLKGRLKRVTITREGTHWYVSILVSVRIRRVMAPQNPITADDVVGIDRGVEVPVATSTGELLGQRVTTRRDRSKTSRLQKNLARTQKGSRRREKALMRLRAHQAKLVRKRRDRNHKITSHLAKNHRVIVIERLNVEAMTRSARGTVEAPGRNVAQRSGLNSSIHDSGWGEIRCQLLYKLDRSGGRLIEVPARNTSRTCARCHAVDAGSRIRRDLFRCTSCGHEAHADINAGIEIRRRGLEALGLGPRPELSGQSVEPSVRDMAMNRKEKKEGHRPQGLPSPQEVMV